MEKLSYKIEAFEGPMDLLLTLISKNKINIYDIPISELLEQYMEQIRIMQEVNMDVASEFLEMAARLVHIKSVSLLPKKADEEELLKRELTGQLLEYQLCKDIAKKLSEQVSFDKLVREQEDIPLDQEYKRSHEGFELVRAYLNAVGRGKRFLPPPQERFSGIVSRPFVSVTSQVVFILRRLVKNTKMTYNSLFKGKGEKSERVAAFLAILELVKGKRVRIDGDGEDCSVRLINGGAEAESK